MKQMLNAFYSRPLALYLAAALFVLSCAAGPAEAMLLPAPHATGVSQADRASDLAMVQRTLESKALQQRLLDYGLTPEEAMVRINALSDEQLHQLAANIDSVQAGGDALGFLFGVALIALLVVLIIYLLEGRIVVQRR
jgi:hypothetical protein